MKKIIILILIILVGYIGYQQYEKTKLLEVSQDISKTGYAISLEFDQEKWEASSSEGDYVFGYEGGTILRSRENKDIYVSFSYELENNGDDTPIQVGDTGAPLFPPQRNELVNDFGSEGYMKIGDYLGYELYLTTYNEFGSAVAVQKLKTGEVTGVMPLLSGDQERVNYYDKFTITARYGENEQDYKKFHKEFIKILKSMKIEKIES